MVLSALLIAVPVSCSNGSGSNANPTSTAAPDSGKPLPDVVLSDLEGKPVPMRTLAAGTVTVLNYWYATCPPCKEEMPALGAVAKEFTGRVTFVGINPQDDAATARAVAAERGTAYRQLLDSTQRSVDALGLTGFPTTVIVRTDGTVSQSIRRALSADELRSMLNEVLAA